jgi:hypothetical protein
MLGCGFHLIASTLEVLNIPPQKTWSIECSRESKASLIECDSKQSETSLWVTATASGGVHVTLSVTCTEPDRRWSPLGHLLPN